MYYIAGCCTLILLQLWSSQSPTAVFLCSAILLVYLFQQTWGFIPFFFCFHADTCWKKFSKSGMYRTSLPLALCQSQHWCRARVVALALPFVWFHLLLQHLVLSPVAFQRESHTSLFSTSSSPLWFCTETQILFQDMKFVQQGPGKFMAPEQPSPHQQGHRSCMKYSCQSLMDFLITAFTRDRTCAFVIFVTL